jgi:hypothetical protein
MTSLRNNAPRRYIVDAVGRRVLIGLTHEETFEFERLDSLVPTDEHDRHLRPATGEERWLELYAKHEGAWKAWIAQSRAEQGFVNQGLSLY